MVVVLRRQWRDVALILLFLKLWPGTISVYPTQVMEEVTKSSWPDNMPHVHLFIGKERNKKVAAIDSFISAVYQSVSLYSFM